MTDEEKYQQELKKAGVELPELKEGDDKKPEAEDKKPEAEKPEGDDKKPEDKAPLLDKKPEEPRKRTIYDDYKDKKEELKSEKELREKAERERDELQQKLDKASKPGAEIEATDDAVAYAKKIGADPDLVQRIISDARKGFEPKTDESLKKDLDEFKTWRTSNAKTIEQQLFNDEFEKTVPSLKTLFPTINDDELKNVKKELDTLSHTKEWHDKSLDYVAFKNQEALSKLVSPRRRGMESKERKGDEAISSEFDPAADLSRMTPKERTQWEKDYKNFTKGDGGLVEGANGKKIII